MRVVLCKHRQRFDLSACRGIVIRRGAILLAVVGVLHNPTLLFSQQSMFTKRMAELSDRLAFAAKGSILAIKGKTVYVNLGQNAGIVQGNKFEVVRLGEPLMLGNNVLGYEEAIIGEVEIFRAREQMAIANVIKQDQPFQKGDRVYQVKKRIHRVAVAEFPFGHAFNDFTKNVQDMLYTHLIQKGMSVVERHKVEQIMQEHRLSRSGIIDFTTAKQIGNMLGVQGVIVGDIADMGNSVAIRGRLIDAGKGVAITAAMVELGKTPDIVVLLAGGRRSGPAGGELNRVRKPFQGERPVAQAAGGILAQGDIEAGAKVYKSLRCVSCHGEDGKGLGPAAKAMKIKAGDWTDKAAMDKLTDEYLADIVMKGGKVLNKSKRMPGYAKKLKSNEVKDLVAYIRSFAS